MKTILSCIGLCAVVGIVSFSSPAGGADTPSCMEYHVSIYGSDTNEGSAARPLRTISAAAQLAQPGNVITVHEGVYRERVNPPRGGLSDQKRIVYRGAPGEKVVIKGSEIARGWRKVQNDTWKVVIPNCFFGDFNPYSDLIRGDWYRPKEQDCHTGAVYLNGHWLTEAAKREDVLKPIEGTPLWFGQVDETNTTILAQFKDVNPNEANVEINVRQTVFYPEKPGINYITVRDFTMEHAATPWAPPTTEQIGLIGTNWSKGWTIENNNIRYSVCTGITLGKYGDAQDSGDYYKTIERALENGWSKQNIGHHIVRNNHISHCEQSGIVGSMGPVFCTITHNVIHDIHIRKLFGGAEMAGIKFHGAIDTVISHNHIYRSGNFGIWLDWMTQGTRVTGNLLRDNDVRDLFVEVNHGPFLVDHNLFLSNKSLLINSQGGAYVHNLIAGTVHVNHGESRKTPYHKAHSTEVVELHGNPSGDDRYYNNIFVQRYVSQSDIGRNGLTLYDPAKLPVFMGGNVFLKGAKPCKHEQNPFVRSNFDPGIKLVEKPDGLYLQISLDKAWAKKQSRQLVTTEILGKAKIPNLPFEQPDGSPYRLDTDYFGKKRNAANPYPGPFEIIEGGKHVFKVSYPREELIMHIPMNGVGDDIVGSSPCTIHDGPLVYTGGISDDAVKLNHEGSGRMDYKVTWATGIGGGFTIATWIRPVEDAPGWSDIFRKDDPLGFQLCQCPTAGVVRVMIKFPDPVGDIHLTISDAVAAGKWSYVVFTYDGNCIRGYKNGALAATSDPIGVPFPTLEQKLTVGKSGWRGDLDDVRVYNYALSIPI